MGKVHIVGFERLERDESESGDFCPSGRLNRLKDAVGCTVVFSGVSSYEALGHVPLKFRKFCALFSFCQLNCKHFEKSPKKDM